MCVWVCAVIFPITDNYKKKYLKLHKHNIMLVQISIFQSTLFSLSSIIKKNSFICTECNEFQTEPINGELESVVFAFVVFD